jgi:hypothetical protein
VIQESSKEVRKSLEKKKTTMKVIPDTKEVVMEIKEASEKESDSEDASLNDADPTEEIDGP